MAWDSYSGSSVWQPSQTVRTNPRHFFVWSSLHCTSTNFPYCLILQEYVRTVPFPSPKGSIPLFLQETSHCYNLTSCKDKKCSFRRGITQNALFTLLVPRC